MLNQEVSAGAGDYGIGVFEELSDEDARAWDTLLAHQAQPSPFMRQAYLLALHRTGCASAHLGWQPQWFVLRQGQQVRAAGLLYLKSHSRGEYVFDHAWAHAYAQHGFRYYPKAVCAVPFTPVNGSRLLAHEPSDRLRLIEAMLDWCRQHNISGLHLLFGAEEDLQACQAAGMLLRQTVQFHWRNSAEGYASFGDFLATLTQDKRKKIRQERRKVADAGVSFTAREGTAIETQDWDFFYRCYERTYLEHGNPPYLSRAFFDRMAQDMPEDWLMFIAYRQNRPIAASLIALNVSARVAGQTSPSVAYGRYWGALERVDCLHFEACYYQPVQWCIERGYQRFEGGAQGEHKLARALLPVSSYSAHWLAHPDFFEAVDRYLSQERQAMGEYVDELHRHSPMK
jgi:predicted N-acyltransferase